MRKHGEGPQQKVAIERVLDECVTALHEGEETPAGCLARYPAQRDKLEPLLRVAAHLQAAGTLQARPAFRRAAPSRLRERIAAGRPDSRWEQARTHPLRRRWATAVALALAAWLVIGAILVPASAAALPGEPLYRVKRAVEAVQLAVTWSDRGDAALHLAFAERRLGEMDALAGQGRPAAVAQAATRYRESLTAVETLLGRLDRKRDAWLIEAVLVAADADAARLSALAETAPQEARPSVVQALGASQAVWERAREVLEQDTQGQKPTPAPAVTEPPPATRLPSPTPRVEQAPSAETATAGTPTPAATPTRTSPTRTAQPTPPPPTRATATENPASDVRPPSPTPNVVPVATATASPDPADRATPQNIPTPAPSRPVDATVESGDEPVTGESR